MTIIKSIVTRPGTPGADGGGLASVSADPSPTLGGDLDLDGHAIPGVTDVLAPGDPGDVLTTNAGGTAITAIKPGRIDARVRGAVGDGTTDNTTLLGTLATEAATNGSELWVPDGIYRGQIAMPSHLWIAGTGTIKPPTGASGDGVLSTATGAIEDIVIRGITVDGNAAKSCIIAQATTVTDMRVEGVTLQNTGTGSNTKNGVRFVVVAGLRVIGSRFLDCYAPVGGYSCSDSQFSGNYIDGTTENAFSAVASGGSFVGRGNVWSNNIGININRMGIELIPESGGIFEGPLIFGNSFRLLDAPSSPSVAMGISNVGSRHAQITNNMLICADDDAYAGIEAGNTPQTIMGNTVIGFQTGLSVNSASHVTIVDNRFSGQHSGIVLTSSGSVQIGHAIRGNAILGFRDFGIDINPQTGVCGGHLVEGNTIDRNAGWAGDASAFFRAIRVQRQDIPTSIRGNRIIWGEASPTSGLGGSAFVMVSNSTGDLDGTDIDGNQVIKLAGSGNFYPLDANGSSDAATDVTLGDNLFTGSTGTTAPITTWGVTMS